MLPLAEWVMRGRGQALGLIVVALLTSPVIWPNSILAGSAIALVALRTGSRNGLELWFWSLLPATGLLLIGSYMPMLLISAVLLASLVLRRTVSWSYALMVLAGCGLLAALVLEHAAQASLSVYVDAVQRMLVDLKQQLDDPELQQALPDSISTVFIAGMFGIMLTVSSFLALVLARYWQAGLYNPGGFQREFHSLRLDKAWMLIALLLVMLFFSLGQQYLTWVWIALFPLLVAGVALFHAVAMQRKLGKHWYVGFYCILLLGDLPKLILVALALIDSLIDFRKKLSERNTD